MKEMKKKSVYLTPRADVRGVFLCDGIADVVSIDDGVTRDGWGSGGTLRPEDNDTNEELWMVF
jgi:hypothetical protein